MKERPILFSAPMVKALLEGRKTQTRQLVKPSKKFLAQVDDMESSWLDGYSHMSATQEGFVVMHGEGDYLIECPYGQPGDRLWVKETHASPGKDIVAYRATGECGAFMGDGGGGRIWLHHGYILEAPGYPFGLDTLRTFGLAKYGGRWRPSIHMPRWASRITLEITDVRVERVEEISEEDAIAEGMLDRDAAKKAGGGHFLTPRLRFLNLFYDINKRAKRGENPWVWALTFKVVKP